MTLPKQIPSTDVVNTCQQTFFDGATRAAQVSERERPYPKGRLIVSRTDTNGVITHCNAAFIEISGYEREELIGQPQYILRHPDVPKVLYADLWKTLKQGKKWNGYLKNLCKDGSHYWVYATVIPNIRQGELIGYSSVRREMSRSKINETIAQYQALKAKEEGALS